MEFEKEDYECAMATMDASRMRHNGYEATIWDDALIGQHVKTEFGNGSVSHIKAFEGLLYCSIVLETSGTVTLLREQVDQLPRVEMQNRTPEPEYEPARRSGGRRKGEKYSYTPFVATLSNGTSQSKTADRSGLATKKKMELPKHTKSGRVPNIMGHIRMYNPTKGWGFVVCSDFEGDVFLHSKHILGNPPPEYIGHFNSCAKGHSVKFDLDVHDNDRPQALNVRMIGGALSSKKEDSHKIGMKPKPQSMTMAPNPQFNSYISNAQNHKSDKGDSLKSHSGAPSVESQWENWERQTDQWGNGKLHERSNIMQDSQRQPLLERDLQQQHLQDSQLENTSEQPGDWYCPNPQCRDLQFTRNFRCRVCGTPKPSNGRAQSQVAPQKGKGRGSEPAMPTDNYVSNGYPQQTYAQQYQARPVNGYPQGYPYPMQSGHPVQAPQYTHPLASHASQLAPPMQHHAPTHPMTVQGYGNYGASANLPQYSVAYHQYLTQSPYQQASHPMQSQYSTSAYDSPRPQLYESEYQAASPYIYAANPHTPPSFDYGPPLSSVQMTPPSQPPQYVNYDRI